MPGVWIREGPSRLRAGARVCTGRRWVHVYRRYVTWWKSTGPETGVPILVVSQVLWPRLHSLTSPELALFICETRTLR